MNTTSHESAAVRAAAARQQLLALVQVAAAVVVAGGFVLIAVKAWGQIERLIWRPAELAHALSAGASLATTFPLRFACLVLGSIGVMLAAEYRPRAFLRVSTAAWVTLGVAGTGAYLLSALDAGSRWAFGLLLGASIAVAVVLLVRRRPDGEPFDVPAGSSRGRSLLPVLVGLVGGLLAVRASIEPVTEWDAVVYHVSFARDWLDALPGLPHAAGPSVGAELSYNYPALFPSVSVAVAGPLHLGVGSVARLVSPLAAITILALLRAASPPGRFVGCAASMFLLGSTFFVAYGQWPTAYMLMTLFLTLAAVRVAAEKRLSLTTALCIGLAAATGWIGTVLGGILIAVFLAWLLGKRVSRPAGTRRSPLRVPSAALLKSAVLVVPLGVVVVASLRSTGGLFFPWVTWPHAAHLLPSIYWTATQREILANSYGQFDTTVGTILDALVGVAKSGLLAPGGLAVQGLIVAAIAVAIARRRPTLIVGLATVVGSVVLLVVLELVWLRYFLPMVVATAAGLGLVASVLRERRGGVHRIAYAGAVAAASLSVASGVAYALAGPNDRTYTAKMDYRTERSSAFESASDAANVRQRREAVYGDDSRAWDDIDRLDAGRVSVGTFDIRNYYSPYDPARQLDGLAGAAIEGRTGAEIARQLRAHGIDGVFIPSWFWEPGAARHPLADRSPVSLWVGGPKLRAARVYLPDPYVSYPSVLYAAGTESAVARVNHVLKSPVISVAGPLSTHVTATQGAFSVVGPIGGPLHWRIAAPVTEIGGPGVRVTTTDVTAARGVAVFEPKTPTLVKPAGFIDCSRVPDWARVATLDLAFPGSPLGFAYLDVGIAGRPRTLRAMVRKLSSTNGILVRACGDPTTARGGIFPTGSTKGRVIVEPDNRRRAALTFDYRDKGRRAVSFNLFDEAHDHWLYSVATLHRCGSGGWVRARLPLDIRPSADPETVELGPVVTGRDLIVRNLRLVHGVQQQTDCETAG